MPFLYMIHLICLRFYSVSKDMANALSQLAKIKWLQNNYSAAIEIEENVLGMRKSVLGNTHRDIAVSFHSLGKINQHLGDLSEKTESLYKSAIAILNLPNNYCAIEHAAILNTYSAYFLQKGILPAAEKLKRQEVELREKVGAVTPLYVKSLWELGTMMGFATENEFYATCREKSIGLLKSIYGENHRKVLMRVQENELIEKNANCFVDYN